MNCYWLFFTMMQDMFLILAVLLCHTFVDEQHVSYVKKICKMSITYNQNMWKINHLLSAQL